MTKIYFTIALVTVLLLSFNNTVPSSYEIHYNKGLTDSIVFVNYNISSDSSCNFYMDYQLFMTRFKENNYEKVYQYHCSHLPTDDTINYANYRRKEFYHNNNPDDAEYYQSGSSSNEQTGNGSLKPTNSAIQPTRPYNYRKPK
ncbi:MAG: hypothetical protein V4622_05520 [Bacteroidota bacterium]